MEIVPLNKIVGQPTLNSVHHLAEQLATTKWSGKHGFPPLVLSEAKMRLTDGDNNFNCKQLANPELLNQKIEDNTKGSEILQLQ